MGALLDRDSKIYVAGHRGLVGSAIWKNLQERGYHRLVGLPHSQLDLQDPAATKAFFDKEQPDAVVLAAAKVGGIMANNTYRADFIYQNLQIQQNIIGESYRHGVQRLLFLGSTCIYPRDARQPIKEEALLTGVLEYTNEPYALAKIAGLKMCESFNLQYGTDYIAVMPTNLYGPNDNFDLINSHVMPAMIRKIHLAKLLGRGDFEGVKSDLEKRPVEGVTTPTDLQHFGIYPDRVVLWGTGAPLREFLWSEDMADASVHILINTRFSDLYPAGSQEIRNCHINIGTGKEISIKDLALLIAKTEDYKGEILWDSSKPDGTPRKLTDVSKLHDLGWRHKVELEEGVEKLYKWYLEH
ncbi:MAG: GDP-L-fucose synthase [Porphyromonas sp.]|nr:GDP-L-fucose synthase [Porphyromonas sp.]